MIIHSFQGPHTASYSSFEIGMKGVEGDGFWGGSEAKGVVNGGRTAVEICEGSEESFTIFAKDEGEG